MSFELFENPWASGGAMHRQLPYVQASQDYGWGHGNDYFRPKTKEQIHKEAMIQLAILAVAVAAPAVIGAIGGAGTAVGGAGMGSAAEGLGATITQGTVAATGGGASAASSTLGISIAAGAAVNAAMQPFLNPQNVQVIKSAASMGDDALFKAFTMQADPPGSPPRTDFVYNPGPHEDQPVYMPFEYQEPSREPMRLLKAVTEKLEQMPLMRRLAEKVAREQDQLGGSRTLDAVERDPSGGLRASSTLRRVLMEQAVEAAKNLGVGNVWEESQWTGNSSPPKTSKIEDQIEPQMLSLFGGDPKYKKSREKIKWLELDKKAWDEAMEEYDNAPDAAARLQTIYKYYERLLDVGRQIPWNVASDHLDYFLHGTPGPDGKLAPKCVDPQYLFQFPRVINSASRLVKYVFYGASGFDDGIIGQLDEINVGSSKVFINSWDAIVPYPTWSIGIGPFYKEKALLDEWDELAYSLGIFQITVNHETEVVKTGPNTANFSGTLNFTLEDPYDWKNGDSVIINLGEDQLKILDDWAQQLKVAGMAHSFVMKSNLSFHYQGRIENGEVVEIHLSNPNSHECN